MFVSERKLSKKPWWKLKIFFFNTDKFSNHDINKFILSLWKGVYQHEYMDDWEKFSETSLPEEDLKQSSKQRRYY